ncbi:nucleoside hydrolase [Streptomyces cyaneus]|uniref:nucleoside hydrolase n=1 Tax=Streptomyces cyaneus TaxID=1904 RepID=UPI000FF8808D|nr:nucleoside hydrolase [Streptomyces cyaneus]
MTSLTVVIDADPGTDDAIGILVALGHADLELRGVTTVGGNAAVDVTTDNALRLLSAVDRPVPVFAGCATPLGARERFGHGFLARPHRPGRDREGLGLPPTSRRAEDVSAVDFLIDTFTGEQAANAVLVATGPLTNVASALLRRPDLARSLRRLVVMGGARGQGNVTPSADFNFWADPEAARVVLRAGLPDVVLFPLDATRSAPLTESDCVAIERSGHVGALAADIIRSRMPTRAADGSVPDPATTATVHDALCTAHLVAPVLQASERCEVDVDTSESGRRGTSVMKRASGRDSPGVEVALRARSDILARTIGAATRRMSADGTPTGASSR